MQTDMDLESSKTSNGVLEDLIPSPISIFEETQTEALSESTNQLVARYRSLLAKENYQAVQRRASSAVAAEAYFEQASQIHTIGHTEVGIYAPFVLARSALRTIYKRQVAAVLLIGLVVMLALATNLTLTLTLIMAIVTGFYFANLLITLYLSFRVFDQTSEIQIPDEIVHLLTDVEWPRYTILCPLYKEAAVVQQFASAMQKLDYPTDKLQILFLTEADDEGTRAAIRAANLPAHFEIVVVPDGKPRTKPRACNYGLLKANGDFVVIYDAEDMPDILQLKKAVLAFAEHGLDVGCIQAKLNFYNSRQNILTRWFTIEYSTWFDATLPGLQWGQFALPLGGTSNHFRLSSLRGIGAWDAYNVTEDCDLGLRLASEGFRTMVLDSTTYEEANPNVRNWIRQRSRWIKGYMQSYLIYMRRPLLYSNPLKWRDFISMQLIVGGRTAVLLINPIMWLILGLFFVFRNVPSVVSVYQMFFPGLVLYFAVLCLIFGNLTYIYTHFIGCLKRGEFGLVKWTLLMPIYWLLGSYAGFKGLYQLITKPHYWEKTTHGLHLSQPTQLAPVQSASISSDLPSEFNEGSQRQWQLESEPKYRENFPIPLAQKISIDHAGSNQSIGGVQTKQVDTHNWVQITLPTWRLNDIAADNAAQQQPISDVPFRQSMTNKITGVFRFRQDPYFLMAFLCAVIAGVLATIHYFQSHELLIYADAASHLGMARLIFDDAKPGLNHLGGVWLPLPHLLMMPFTAIDFLYRTGLAGACVSVPCYIATSIYVFMAARRITHNNLASFIGSLVFILNPNILYLQTTPLTESLAALTLTAASYYFLAWVQEEKPKHLLLLAFMTFLATLSRYDGWGLFGGILLLLPLVSWLKHRQRTLTEAHTIIYILLSGIGILLWFLWCWVILGDPLYFQRSIYSAQFQQQDFIAHGAVIHTYHNLVESLRYFIVLSAVTVGPIPFVLALGGLIIFFIRRRFSLEIFVPFIFLTPLAFYIFSAYSGQISIQLPQLGYQDAYFNVRYGVVALAPAAIFVAVAICDFRGLFDKFVLRLWRFPTLFYQFAWPILCVSLILGQTFITSQTGIISLQDGQFGWSCLPDQAVMHYLERHYDGGKILVDFYTNYTLYALGPTAGVDYKNLIYQSSGSKWKSALQKPETVNWIIIDYSDKNDQVAQAFKQSNSTFLAQFSEVAREPHRDRRLYRRLGLPSLPDHVIDLDTQIANQDCKLY
ncbi:MAG: glycosyltransferase [Anaerolineae bacterium]|nr:glycosyltransferase [Anaerolineae bacterium]